MRPTPAARVAGSSRFVADQAAMRKLLSGPDGAVARDLSRRVLRIERAAKRLCPVDTGRLRSSITSRVTRDGRGLVGIIGTNVDYAPHVEFGTSTQAAQPFLRPAVVEGGGPSADR